MEVALFCRLVKVVALVLVTVWLQFRSLERSKRFACNAFGSQTTKCISGSPPRFGTGTTREEENRERNDAGMSDRGARGRHWSARPHPPPGVRSSVTPPLLHLHMTDSSGGSKFSTGMTGVRGQGSEGGVTGSWTHIGT